MHPRFRELLDYLAAARRGLLAAVAGATSAQLEYRPSPDAWSPAETLEHLRMTEASIVKVLQRLLTKADLTQVGRETETTSVMGQLDAYRMTEALRSVPAPEFVLPARGASAEAALAALPHSRAALEQVVAQADGWAVGKLSFPHALIGPLTFYQWVLFVGQHEVRHTAQIARALRAAAGEPR
ncbi:MAG: DinB family protein [Gemmatimonadales bacterium]